MSVAGEVSENVTWGVLGLGVLALVGFTFFQLRACSAESMAECTRACASAGGVREMNSQHCECEGAR